MSRIIVVTSGKGGVGKTNISVSLASELALRKYRTCLFDADLGSANVPMLLGLEPQKTLDDFFRDELPLAEVVCSTSYGLDIISTSSGINKVAHLDALQIRRLVDGFTQLEKYDFFVVDSPAGISRGGISICLAANEIVLVITSEPTSLNDSYALLKVLAAHQYSGTVRILVNKSATIERAKETYIHFKSVVYRQLEIDIVPAGAVMFDEAVDEAVKQHKSFISHANECSAAECIRTIISNLLRGAGNRDEESDDLGQFWTRFFDINNSVATLSHDGASEDVGAGREMQAGNVESFPEANYGEDESAGQEQREPVAEIKSFWKDFEFHTLPTPRPLLSQILFLQAEGKLTLERLCTIISADPVLYGRVLQLYYALHHRSPVRGHRLSDIISELGVQAVVDLAMSVAMHLGLLGNPQEEALFENHFCLHSLTSAMLARKLAEAAGYLFPEEAFLAALFHDLGRLVLQMQFPQPIESGVDRLVSFAHTPEMAEAERDSAGMSHAQLGGEIVAGLHCNSFVVDAVRFHAEEESQVANGFELVRLVFVAQALAIARGAELEHGAELASVYFDLPASQCLEFCRDVHREVENFADEFALMAVRRLGSFEERREESPEQFRRRVVDYAMIQGVMPKPFAAENSTEALKCIFQNLYLMFGVDEAFLMIPVTDKNRLQAIGYPDSFCGDMLVQLQLSLDARKSIVVQTFRAGRFNMSRENELASVADRQLLGLLSRAYLVSFPLPSLRGCDGVMLFGTTEEKASLIREQQGRFVQFGAQISAILAQFEWG